VAIWYILWPFGTFYNCLVHFSRFGMLYQEKSGNPDLGRLRNAQLKVRRLIQNLPQLLFVHAPTSPNKLSAL
jgi:hypothetical protein